LGGAHGTLVHARVQGLLQERLVLDADGQEAPQEGGSFFLCTHGRLQEVHCPERKGGEKGGSPTKVAPAPLAGRAALAARRVDRLVMRAEVLKTSSNLDDLGTAVTSEAKARLWYDKDQLESHIQQVIDTFDSAVASLEKEKAKLESDLKNADMKLLVLYEELLMLNDLEEKDEALLKKSNKCRNDKAGIMHKIKECQDHLVEKKAEIEQWQAEEANLQAEFTDLVGESSPFLGTLLKIYKKKVKRSKRKKAMGDDDDMDEECDALDEDHDWDDEEVRCLAKEIAMDCRACWAHGLSELHNFLLI